MVIYFQLTGVLSSYNMITAGHLIDGETEAQRGDLPEVMC